MIEYKPTVEAAEESADRLDRSYAALARLMTIELRPLPIGRDEPSAE